MICWECWKWFPEGWAVSSTTAAPDQPEFGPELAMPTHHHMVWFCYALAPLETQCCCPTVPSKLWKYPWGDTGTISGAEYLEHHIIPNMSHFHLRGGERAVCFVNSELWLIYSNISMPGEVDQNILWIYKYSYTNICHICIVITLFHGRKSVSLRKVQSSRGFLLSYLSLTKLCNFKRSVTLALF